jgi:hypothetical protein
VISDERTTSVTVMGARTSVGPKSMSQRRFTVATVHPFHAGFLSHSDETQIARSADDRASVAA